METALVILLGFFVGVSVSLAFMLRHGDKRYMEGFRAGLPPWFKEVGQLERMATLPDTRPDRMNQ